MCGSVTWQFYVIPVRLQVRFRIGGLKCDAQGRRLARTMRDIQGDGHKKLQSLRSTHDQGGEHGLTWRGDSKWFTLEMIQWWSPRKRKSIITPQPYQQAIEKQHILQSMLGRTTSNYISRDLLQAKHIHTVHTTITTTGEKQIVFTSTDETSQKSVSKGTRTQNSIK